MAAAKSKASGPDATQIMLQKNDRIRERHVKDIRRIGTEEQKTADELQRQIRDLQKEIRDIHAYTVVYKDHSLVSTDQRRSKPSYTNLVNNQQMFPTHVTRSAISRRSRHKASSAKERSMDPFHVKSCLLDVEHDREIHWETKQPQPIHLTPLDEPKKTIKTRVKRNRSSTAVNARTASKEYESLLPGNCTSYYSIRKFYEEEKEKLLHKWSPEERRRQTVKWILDNIKFPEFSEIRKTTTSAIFRDFNKHKHGKPTITSKKGSQSNDLLTPEEIPSSPIQEVTSPIQEVTSPIQEVTVTPPISVVASPIPDVTPPKTRFREINFATEINKTPVQKQMSSLPLISVNDRQLRQKAGHQKK